MQLPNKLYSYERSTLALVPKVLNILKNQQMSVLDLYRDMEQELEEASDFVAVMDCLYALRAIDITDEGEVFICL
ncbi:ABC-three component system middle component 7 [Bacteroides caecimuris]|jgi:hypothetical protein|uniref:ABC-three component system middle component 7 n=1 Tax=Bacteroides caecimuris TaxID=1796613 RepID=UPI00322073B2